MGPAETTGIVIVTVAIIQGIFKFAEHLIAKYGNSENKEVNVGGEAGISNKEIMEKLNNIAFGLSERGYNTQKEIVSELRSIAETQHKTLALIERLVNKLED